MRLRFKLDDAAFGRLVRGEVVDLDGGAIQLALADIGYARMVAHVFERLSGEELVAVVAELKARWCLACGSEQPSAGRWCQCENDE